MFKKHKFLKIFIICLCGICLALLIYTQPIHFLELIKENKVNQIQLTWTDTDSDKNLADLKITDPNTCSQFIQLFDQFTFQKRIPWRKLLFMGVPSYSDIHTQLFISFSFKTPKNNWEQLYIQLSDNPHDVSIDKIISYSAQRNTNDLYHVGNWWKSDEMELYQEIISFIKKQK